MSYLWSGFSSTPGVRGSAPLSPRHLVREPPGRYPRPATVRFCPTCFSIYTARVAYCGIDGVKLVEEERDPLVGRSIDRYEVLELIGTGAMGRVYRIGHNVLEQLHAMKVLFGDLAADAEVVERFRREARTISKIRHPNVVSVTDFGTTPSGLTFLVMELVNGQGLDKIIKSTAPLPPWRAAQITRQIALGLGAAHELGFVHRDIKPSNIMIVKEGDHEYVKILDFGTVAAGALSIDHKLTAHGFVVGTPRYMAPEQARGGVTLGPSCDLYSLGVTVYEMLTGKPPFEAESAVDLMVKHNLAPIPKLPAADGLEMLVHWLLAKKPEDRPGSAEAVVEEIDRLRFSYEGNAKPSVPIPGLANADTLELFLPKGVRAAAAEELAKAEVLGDRPTIDAPEMQTQELPRTEAEEDRPISLAPEDIKPITPSEPVPLDVRKASSPAEGPPPEAPPPAEARPLPARPPPAPPAPPGRPGRPATERPQTPPPRAMPPVSSNPRPYEHARAARPKGELPQEGAGAEPPRPAPRRPPPPPAPRVPAQERRPARERPGGGVQVRAATAEAPATLTRNPPEAAPPPAGRTGSDLQDPASAPGAQAAPGSGQPNPASRLQSTAGDGSYLDLRWRLDELHTVLLRMKDSDQSVEALMDRYEELDAALRPGLMKHRYNVLASKIGSLEEEIASEPS